MPWTYRNMDAVAPQGSKYLRSCIEGMAGSRAFRPLAVDDRSEAREMAWPCEEAGADMLGECKK